MDEPDNRNLNQRAYIRCRDQDPSKLQNTVTVCRRRVLGDSPLLIMTQTRLEMPLCLIIKIFFSSQVEVFPLHSGLQAGRSRWYIFGTLPTGCTFKRPEVCEKPFLQPDCQDSPPEGLVATGICSSRNLLQPGLAGWGLSAVTHHRDSVAETVLTLDWAYCR